MNIYTAQVLRLPNQHTFLCALGHDGFVPSPWITSFPLILPLKPLKLALELILKVAHKH